MKSKHSSKYYKSFKDIKCVLILKYNLSGCWVADIFVNFYYIIVKKHILIHAATNGQCYKTFLYVIYKL
jgi:hypothetical protein